MKIHLFTDADNTLWDTNAIFADAQVTLLRDVERFTGLKAPKAQDNGLKFLRSIDQAIAMAHVDHLRYPPILLARAIAFALRGEHPKQAAARAELEADLLPSFDEAVSAYISNLQATPHLRAGVREALVALSSLGVPVTVITEGAIERCRQVLATHALDHFVSDVISLKKSAQSFTELKRQLVGTRVLVVGDQLDRDIAAASEAGFETIYFPGGFRPAWTLGLSIRPNYEITRFDEIIALLTPYHE